MIFDKQQYSEGLFEDVNKEVKPETKNDLSTMSRAERNAFLGFQRTKDGMVARSSSQAYHADPEIYTGKYDISDPTNWVPADASDTYNLMRLGVKL